MRADLGAYFANLQGFDAESGDVLMIFPHARLLRGRSGSSVSPCANHGDVRNVPSKPVRAVGVRETISTNHAIQPADSRKPEDGGS